LLSLVMLVGGTHHVPEVYGDDGSWRIASSSHKVNALAPRADEKIARVDKPNL